MREALRTAGVALTSITVPAPQSFRVEGIPQDRNAELRRIADEQAATNYDRSAGAGGTFEFRLKPNIERTMREQAVVQARTTIDRRVNELGVTEPNISVYGDSGDQILVQLPGVTDVARAKEIIRSTAQLELKLVEGGPSSPRKRCWSARRQGAGGHGDRFGAGSSDEGGVGTVFYLVRKIPAVTGNDLRGAKPTIDENSRPAVSFSLRNEGARKFGKVTGENIGRIAGDRPRQARRCRRRASTGGSPTKGASAACSRRRKWRTSR